MQQALEPIMSSLATDLSGKPFDLNLPPFRPASELPSNTTLPHIHEVLPSLGGMQLRVASSPDRSLEATAMRRNRKRPLVRSDGDEADPGVRVSKRRCRRRPDLVKDVDWNLEVHKDIRPPYTYVELAKMAIVSTPEKAMSLESICAFIAANYAYYRLQYTSKWKMGVNGALSRSKEIKLVYHATRINLHVWKVNDDIAP